MEQIKVHVRQRREAPHSLGLGQRRDKREPLARRRKVVPGFF
jgi:hypothetical protein